MDDCIGIKAVTCPKIRSDVSMRGCHIRTMDNFEIIISKSGCRLRNKDNIAELKSGKCKISVVCLKTMTGKLTINSCYLFRHFLTEIIYSPFFIIGAGYNLRIGFFDKIRHCPCRVISEYPTTVIDQFLKHCE